MSGLRAKIREIISNRLFVKYPDTRRAAFAWKKHAGPDNY